jgi:hypothetical protein
MKKHLAEIVARVDEVRRRRGLTQDDVSRAWRCTRQNVGHVLARRQDISLAQLIAFAELAGVTVGKLVDRVRR